MTTRRSLLKGGTILTLLLALVPWIWDRVASFGWTMHNELSRCGEMLDVAVGAEGRVWVACDQAAPERGFGEHVVYAFDGSTWTQIWRGIEMGTVFRPAPGRYEGGIMGLAVGPDGRIWAAHEKAISVNDGRRWTMFPAPDTLVGSKTDPFPYLSAIAVDSRGRVWVGTFQTIPDFEEGENAAVGMFDGREWTVYTGPLPTVIQAALRKQGVMPKAPDLPRAREVGEIAADRRGRIWVGLDGGPLVAFDGRAWIRQPLMSDVTSVAIDRADRVWVRSGLYKRPRELADRGVHTLYMYDGNQWQRVSRRDLSEAYRQNAMSFDSMNRAWVVVSGGYLLILDRGAESVLTQENVGLRVSPRLVAAGEDGRVWVAGDRGGVQSFEGGRPHPVPRSLTMLRRIWPFSLSLSVALLMAFVLGVNRVPPPLDGGDRPATQAISVKGVWVQWFLSNTIGFAIGAAAGIAVAVSRLARCRNDCDILAFGLWITVVVPWMIILGGLVAAGIQARIIFRPIAPRAGWWVFSTAAGLFLGAAILGFILRLELARGPLRLGALFAFAAMIGVAQWLFLRSRVLRAGWWIPAVILAFTPVLWFLIFQFEPLVTLRMLGERGWGIGLSLTVAIAVLVGYGIWIGMISGILGAALVPSAAPHTGQVTKAPDVR